MGGTPPECWRTLSSSMLMDPTAPPPFATLVGRARDLAELRAAVEAALVGRGSLALVSGEAGIGKTRLVEEVASHAAERGAAVLWGACWEGEGAPAFWPWIQIIRAYSRVREPATVAAHMGAGAGDIGRLLPETGVDPGETEEPELRFRLFDSVATFLGNAAAEQPLVLVIDDLQWADRPSLLLLRFVAHELRGQRVLLLGTYRSGEADDALADIARMAPPLRLGGLDERDVGRLVAATTGTAPPGGQLVSLLHARTGGNPFFVIEIVRLLVGEGRLEQVERVPHALLSVPRSVRRVILGRVAGLEQACVEALTQAAVLGQEFDVETLGVMSALSRARLTDLLDQALRAGIVSNPGVSRYAFAHALMREALYHEVPPSRRAGLHLLAGKTIERRFGDDLEPRLRELAHHFLLAAAPDKALEYAQRAGRQALAMLAYEEAAEHFMHALDLLPAGAEQTRVELLLALGDAQLRAGSLAAAREAFQQAAELARRRQRPEELARAALGFGAGLSGFEVPVLDQRQIDLLEEAREALDPQEPLRAWTAARLSVALSFVGPSERRRALSEEAVAAARRIGDDAALAYALASYCDVIPGPAHAEERRAAATEVVRLAAGAGERPMELLGRRLRLVALLELGDIRAVDAEIEAFARTAEALRQPLFLWYAPMWRAMRALMQGRLADVERLQAEAARIAARAPSENAHCSQGERRCGWRLSGVKRARRSGSSGP